MPYIKPNDRFRLDDFINKLQTQCGSWGELNYIITRLILSNALDFNLNYDEIQEMIGLLECIKLELYRRVAGPYEDKKIKENGDVSEYAAIQKQS